MNDFVKYFSLFPAISISIITQDLLCNATMYFFFYPNVFPALQQTLSPSALPLIPGRLLLQGSHTPMPFSKPHFALATVLPPHLLGFSLFFRSEVANQIPTGARQKSYLSEVGQYRKTVHLHRGMLIPLLYENSNARILISSY